ncbi:MAG: coniferyl aldehyde dehydrogenase [Pseudomonadales bacterium]|nr:coniferyl aldehyde dehydrogenase [Pseudomonadales bacterium]
MPTSAAATFSITDQESLLGMFEQQKSAFSEQPYPTAEQRIADIRRLKQAILAQQDALAAAISEDFSGRSVDETRIAELMTSVDGINNTLKNLKKWMKPSKRKVGILFAPANNRVIYQPLGVVGIIVPWNYPLFLALGPLVTALAAGNRAMIKLSEFTPAFNRLFATIMADIFKPSQVAIVEGEADISSRFSQLAFDHIFFTGSTAVGKKVMAAAAENLTPVTLELGGKSPVLIAPGADIHAAAERICFGKSLNAGQTCVAPDYILLPEGQAPAFKAAYEKVFSKMYPTLKNNSDYTAIINDRQQQRLQALLKDAKDKGATITEINPGNETLTGTRKMPVSLIENASDDSAVMQEEVFGPLLPIVSYQSLEQAIDYINARPRPLALYLFSYDKKVHDRVLHQTHSGGVTVNNTLVHLAQEDLPFGGIGPSGMGHYHGYEGFLSLSKAKAVHRIGRFNSGKLAYPPYGTAIHKLIYSFFIR